jgi:DNA-nicking Smr family endonuclease
MRALRGEERALWHEAMRSVKPLRRRSMPEPMTKPVPVAPGAAKNVEAPVPPPKPATAPGIVTVDRRSAQRLKRGALPIEARLDLHGMTQDKAHAALSRFVARAQNHGMRAVLVITGKSGVLYGNVPRWLEEGDNRGRVVAASRAHTQHGGDGALYLLLRRLR